MGLEDLRRDAAAVRSAPPAPAPPRQPEAPPPTKHGGLAALRQDAAEMRGEDPRTVTPPTAPPTPKTGLTLSDLVRGTTENPPTPTSERILKGLGRGVVQTVTTPAKLAGTVLDLLNRGESAVLNPVERAIGLTPKPGVTAGPLLRVPAEAVEKGYEGVAPVTPATGWKERGIDIGSELVGGAAGFTGAQAAAGRLGRRFLSGAGNVAKEAVESAIPKATVKAPAAERPTVEFRPDLLTAKPTLRAVTNPKGVTTMRPATTKVPPPTPAEVETAMAPPRTLDAPPAATAPPAGKDVERLDHLYDEQGVLKAPEAVDQIRGWAKFWKDTKAALPQEEFVRRARPDSPVITEIERYNSTLGDRLSADVVKSPWFKELKQLTPAQLNQYEAEAARIFEAGGRTPAAFNDAIANWPAALQQYVRHRNTNLALEQTARNYLGLEPVPEMPGPYLPSITDAEARGITQVAPHEGAGGLQTTLKGAMEHRVFPTQLQGEAAGVPYIDRRNAVVLREWNGLKLQRTADLVRRLEGRTLFRTREAAQAASPTRRAFAIEGIPGNRTWWAPTQEEATFLAQNLADAPHGGPATLKYYADALFRNPNLFNPAPHAIKNMGAKYLLARGPVGIAKLPVDLVEYTRGGNPKLLAEFKHYMPFSEAEPGYMVLQRALVKDKGPRAAVQWTLDQLGKLNKPSSKVIFQLTDPGMRYSLFKHYRIDKGLPPQEAANHAWIDLVRYGTRSTLTDLWKSIPMDFFIPWRVGTITSLIKQASLYPVRTSLVLGGIDYLREMRYRQTGRWTHLPWDYVEGPIALALQDPKSIPSQAIFTALFGPMGDQTARSIEEMIKNLRGGGKGFGQDTMRVFWGISQFADPMKEFAAYQRDGNESHLVNMLMGALLGERDTKGFQPHRLQRDLPESLPGLEKDRAVRGKELARPQRRSSLDQPSRPAQDSLARLAQDALVGRPG